jgi:hypothetical protein
LDSPGICGETPEKRLPKNGNLFSGIGKEGIGMRN